MEGLIYLKKGYLMINRELSNLKNSNWGEFKIGDIFNIERSKVHDKINLKETHRGIAHISRTNLDNGLNCIVIDENFKHNPKNTIVFGAENANFFFQPFNYITGDKMYVISNEKLNRYNSLFIKLMLEHSIKHSGFGYGKGLTGNRLKRLSILLPITESGLINWDFMESYMETKEKILLSEYKSYLERKLLVMQDREEYLFSEDEFFAKNVKWGNFLIGDLFHVKNGFYNKKPEFFNSGRIPFLGATANNNGITGFSSLEKIEKTSKTGQGKNHSLKEKIFEGNCIAVTNNGSSMGYAYYQKNEFTCSHDINSLYLKEYNLNKYIALFLIVLIEKQKICFEYSRKWRPERMKKSKITIPVTDEGIPDWDFMESYMKKLEYEKVNKYLDYIEDRLN